MKITKFGHCCLLIEENGVRLLTDPGSYSDSQNDVRNLDAILITHEHQDHLHMDSLKEILKNNPDVKIFTNQSVVEILKKENIRAETVADGSHFEVKGLLIEGVGSHHEFLHPSIPAILNTGFFIAGRLFYPGDNLTNPGRPVDILAMPVAAPWMKLSEGIDWVLGLRPEICFPVHDGILKNIGSTNTIPPKVLEPAGIKFLVLELNKEIII